MFRWSSRTRWSAWSQLATWSSIGSRKWSTNPPRYATTSNRRNPIGVKPPPVAALALPRNARLVTGVNVLLAVAAGCLLWRSLDWPLVGDATIFHFIAAQMQNGAVPYRDIIDINMPLIYVIHLAVVAIGGLGDAAWRGFCLGPPPLLSGLFPVLFLAPGGGRPTQPRAPVCSFP